LKQNGNLYMSNILSCKVTLYTGKNEKGAVHKALWAARTSPKEFANRFTPPRRPVAIWKRSHMVYINFPNVSIQRSLLMPLALRPFPWTPSSSSHKETTKIILLQLRVAAGTAASVCPSLDSRPLCYRNPIELHPDKHEPKSTLWHSQRRNIGTKNRMRDLHRSVFSSILLLRFQKGFLSLTKLRICVKTWLRESYHSVAQSMASSLSVAWFLVRIYVPHHVIW